MIIGIAGSLCAGKETVCTWLVRECAFERIHVVHAGIEGELAPSTTTDANGNASDVDSATATADDVPLRMTVDEITAFLMTDRNWQRNYVIAPLYATREDLDALNKRPFFLLLAVDAPLRVRYERFCRKYAAVGYARAGNVHADDGAIVERGLTQLDVSDKQNGAAASLWHRFMDIADQQQPTIARLLNDSQQVISNHFPSQDALFSHLHSLQPSLLDVRRLRPDWDDYFMHLADLASFRSNCMKRRVGCIVVRECRVIATGYNGTPRGLPNCNGGGCARCNDGAANNTMLSECLCMHAEENALLEAGRDRVTGFGAPHSSLPVAPTPSRAIVYCNTCPCLGCAKKMIQVGVGEVVYRMDYGIDSRVKEILKMAGVAVRQHQPSTRMHLRI